MNWLRVVAYEGTPGNPKSKPRDLVSPASGGIELGEAPTTIEVYVGRKTITVGPDGTVSIAEFPQD